MLPVLFCTDSPRPSCRSQAGVEDEKAPSAGAKSLCIPHDQTPYPELDHNCPGCGKVAKRWTLFGRSCKYFSRFHFHEEAIADPSVYFSFHCQ